MRPGSRRERRARESAGEEATEVRALLGRLGMLSEENGSEDWHELHGLLDVRVRDVSRRPFRPSPCDLRRDRRPHPFGADQCGGVRLGLTQRPAASRESRGRISIRPDSTYLGMFSGRITRVGHINFNTPTATGGSPTIFTSRPAPKTSVRMALVMATHPPAVL